MKDWFASLSIELASQFDAVARDDDACRTGSLFWLGSEKEKRGGSQPRAFFALQRNACLKRAIARRRDSM